MGIRKWFSDTFKKQAIRKLVEYLPNASKENIVRMAKVVEKVVSLPEDKQRVRIVRESFQKDHPSTIYVRKMLGGLNPNCRDKFAVNFIVNGLLFGGETRKRVRREEGFQPPTSILISPSMKCNLRCQGCYAADYEKEDGLDIATLDKIVKEGKEIGTRFYTLLGGEPFMYPHLFEFLERHNDCYFQIYTNGTLFDDKVIKKLSDMGNVAPMFSLEGFEKDTNQRRAPGVFQKVMKAMDDCKHAGIFFGYSCYVTKHNAGIIMGEEFIDLMIKKGAQIGWYFLCLPVGKNPTTEFMPTPQQRLYMKMRRDYIRNNKPIFIIDFWNDAPFARGCIAGRHFIHINSRGDIEPCVFVHFATHNIKTTSLKDALKSPFFKAIKNRQPYSDNLYLPCTIIDHPEVLRTVVKEGNAHPTHKDAITLIQDKEIKDNLDIYAREVSDVYQRVWEDDVKKGMWKTAREDTKKKRTGELVE